MQRFFLNVLTFVLLVALAGVSALWVRSYFVPDVIESYQDVPPPPLGQTRPWDQRERWQETSFRSYPGRFEVVSTTTKIKGRRRGEDFNAAEMPGPVVNGWTFSQRDDGRTGEEHATAGGMKRTFGSWQVDFIRPVKIIAADYQELRSTSGQGFTAPYWAVALALGLVPALRLFNTVFRLGRDTHDLLGHRQPGTGFRGQLASTFRLASAGSMVMIVVSGAFWYVCQHVTVRFEGRSAPAANPYWAPPDWMDRQTVIANRAGFYVKAASTPGKRQEPRPETLPPCRYELALAVPSDSHPEGNPDGHDVRFNRYGIYVAEVKGGRARRAAANAGASDANAGNGADSTTTDPDTRPAADDAGNAVASVDEGVNVPKLGALPPDAPLPKSATPPAVVDDEWIAFFPYWSVVAAFALLPAMQVWFYMHPPRMQRREKSHGPLRGMPALSPGRPNIS